jgi:hypothetical protein
MYFGGLSLATFAIRDRQIGAAESPSFVFAEAGVDVSRLLTRSFEGISTCTLATDVCLDDRSWRAFEWFRHLHEYRTEEYAL